MATSAMVDRGCRIRVPGGLRADNHLSVGVRGWASMMRSSFHPEAMVMYLFIHFPVDRRDSGHEPKCGPPGPRVVCLQAQARVPRARQPPCLFPRLKPGNGDLGCAAGACCRGVGFTDEHRTFSHVWACRYSPLRRRVCLETLLCRGRFRGPLMGSSRALSTTRCQLRFSLSHPRFAHLPFAILAEDCRCYTVSRPMRP
jgi:hypothetical protein